MTQDLHKRLARHNSGQVPHTAKNALKLMLGAEYTTARKGGSDCYNGWEFTTAVRWNF